MDLEVGGERLVRVERGVRVNAQEGEIVSVIVTGEGSLGDEAQPSSMASGVGSAISEKDLSQGEDEESSYPSSEAIRMEEARLEAMKAEGKRLRALLRRKSGERADGEGAKGAD